MYTCTHVACYGSSLCGSHSRTLSGSDSIKQQPNDTLNAMQNDLGIFVNILTLLWWEFSGWRALSVPCSRG